MTKFLTNSRVFSPLVIWLLVSMLNVGCKKNEGANRIFDSETIKTSAIVWLENEKIKSPGSVTFIDSIKNSADWAGFSISPLNERSEIIYVPIVYNLNVCGLTFITNKISGKVIDGYISEIGKSSNEKGLFNNTYKSPAQIISGYHNYHLPEFSGAITLYSISGRFLSKTGFKKGVQEYLKSIIGSNEELTSDRQRVKGNSVVDSEKQIGLNGCTLYYLVTYWSDGTSDREYLGMSCTSCEQTMVISRDSTKSVKTNCAGGGGNYYFGGTPFYKYPVNSDYAKLYPKFTALLKNIYKYCLANSTMLDCLKTYSKMTDQQIYNTLQYGSGPTVVIIDLNDPTKYSGSTRAGFFTSKDPGVINIDINAVKDFENNANIDNDAFVFFLSVTLLHESTHYGRILSGFSPGIYEYGNKWETCVFGTEIDDLSGAKIYLQKKQ